MDNFPVSGGPVPAAVARWLGRVRAAAARVNTDLLLDADKARADRRGRRSSGIGDIDDQFPIDVFQVGSGTPST